MLVIAIARWLYHKERSALVHRQRRRIDINRLVERLDEELMLRKNAQEIRKQAEEQI